MTQQLRTFLVQNIPADVSYFELYSGIDPNNLSLAVTNIIPDKFGYVKINFQEYKRAAAVYYKWKIVDVFGNKSDFSDADILTLNNSQIFDKFLIQQINSDVEVLVNESTDPVDNLGVTPKEGFYRYRSALKKADGLPTNFSKEEVLYSSQENGATFHAIFIEVQPAKAYAGEKIRVFWRAEASINASLTNPSSQTTSLFNSPSPISLTGVVEDVAAASIGTYTFTLDSNGTSNTLSKSASYQVVAGSASSIQFMATSTDIFEGDSISLSWNDPNAVAIYIDNGIGSVAIPSGNISVTPTESTIYTLICHDSSGAVSERTVSINVKRRPVINRFGAGDLTIIRGQKIHLGWSVSYANSVSITGIGSVFTSDDDTLNIVNNIDLEPLSTTTYTITALNKAGQPALAPVNYTVTVIDPPEIISFDVSPNNTNVTAGDFVDLVYNAQNATLFTIVGPDGVNYSTSSMFNSSLNTQILAANPPVFERKITFKATASKLSLSDSSTIDLIVTTPLPILYTGAYENPDTTLTDIITDYSNVNAVQFTFNTIWGNSISAKYTSTELISPLISNASLTFHRDGVATNKVMTIDFSNIMDQATYDTDQPISFILSINGPAGSYKKTIVFKKSGIVSIT